MSFFFLFSPSSHSSTFLRSKHYITYLAAVEYYVGALSWAIVNWITINPLINNQVVGTAPAALHLITQFEFGLVIILSLLLAEKVVIQVIAVRDLFQFPIPLSSSMLTLFGHAHDFFYAPSVAVRSR